MTEREVTISIKIDMPDGSRKDYKWASNFSKELAEQFGRGLVELALDDVERNLTND